MKNVSPRCRKIAFLFILIFSVSNAYSQEKADKKEHTFYSEFYVMEVKPMQFKMTYHYPVYDRVTVRITDAYNNILFAEKSLVYKKYQKFFDLTGFNDGQYTFELTDGEKKFVQSFNVVTRVVRMAITNEKKSEIVSGF